MRKTRILHCLYRVGSGGVERKRLSLAQQLDPSRYEQKLICTDAWGGLLTLFKDSGCDVLDLGQIRHIADSRVYRNALKVIKDWQPDIIHGSVYEGVAIAAVCGRLGKVPIIVGEEPCDPKGRRLRGHALYRLLAGLTHHMVAVSPFIHDYLVRMLHIPAHKVTLINNGVAERVPLNDDVIEDFRTRLGLCSENFVIGTVSRLDEQKRTSDLIRALALVQGNGAQHARLLVVGDGPDRELLTALATSLGVIDSVIFTGYQPDPWPFYGVMDVFALASVSEAFGLVLVEAMFASLPIVATRVGGIPTVVEEGRTGVLVPPMAPERLAEAILTLMNNEPARRTMATCGKERARTEFSEKRYISDMDQLYQRLLAQAGLR